MRPPRFSMLTVRRFAFFSTAALVAGLFPFERVLAQEAPATAPAAAESAQAPPKATPYDDFGDFVHFARIGRFDAAGAVAARLLSQPDLDPVRLLETAEADPRSFDTLILIINNTEVSEPAKKILEVIRQGEFQLRRDPARIRQNVDKLGGPPQTEYNAIQRLRESGEYAIPWMMDALTKPDKKVLWPRIVRALPQIGMGAVSPLVQAMEIENDELRVIIARALGELGYAQAVPYLRKLLARDGVLEMARQAARDAIERIEAKSGRTFPAPAADQFTALAAQYYEERGSVKADPRQPTANLWFVRDGFLTAVAVPTEIYGPVMAMRSCQEALKLAPDGAEAIALWLAANIRREARLGMNVESGDPDPNAARDPSAPQDFPRSICFSRTAGPLYCHRVLERAVADRDAAVALGAIAALRTTAGPTSLVGTEDYKQPLAQALQFPDRLVRIKAALALAGALPQTPFAGSQFVAPVLADALAQSAAAQYVVVDSNADNLNRVIGAMRSQGGTVVGDADFYNAMARVRKELNAVSCFLLATDAGAPDLVGAIRQLRAEFAYATTPIVLLVKPPHVALAENVAGSLPGIQNVDAGASAEELAAARDRAAEASGQTAMVPETAAALALEAADVLRRVALDARTPIRFEAAEPALLAAMTAQSEELRIKSAAALALFRSAAAQQSIAKAALNAESNEALRIAMFDALAESARRNANKLDAPLIDPLIQVASDEPVMTLRNAAAQALGALNLTTNKASEIIRKYHLK